MDHPNEDRVRLLEGSRFRVDRVRVPSRDGSAVYREIVVHPGAVVVLALDDDGRVVLIRNTRHALGATLWELPAGTLEAGEDPLAAAARELTEETGYEAASLRPLLGFYSCPGVTTEWMHVFVATRLRHVGQRLEPTEDIRVEPTALDDVLAMIRDLRIEDGKTIAAVLYYRAFGVPSGT
jgi:ADP-ribose pyrophosphatase